MAELHVREERIRAMIEAMARFTATPGRGTTRLTYSDEHRAIRAYLLERMEAAGLETREDAVGNLFGRLEGRDPGLAPVMVGSHFDSVPEGGAFDGPAGIVAGLETAFAFGDLGLRPERSLEVIAMIEEEGGRFGGGLFGSRLLTGQVERAALDEMRDPDGISVAEAMRAFGLDPDAAPSVALAPGAVHAFLELHIEQGPVLEESGEAVGVVGEVVSISQLQVRVRGVAGHAGTTPMAGRRDALVAAARIVAALPALVADMAPEAVGTVGQLSVKPGGANVIPAEAVFSLDLRAPRRDTVRAIIDRLEAALPDLAGEGIEVEMVPQIAIDETPLSAPVHAALVAAAEAADLPWRRMASGAGHDAMILSRITETGLVFVPSRGGISHTPEEWTPYDQLARGVEVIFRAAREMTGA